MVSQRTELHDLGIVQRWGVREKEVGIMYPRFQASASGCMGDILPESREQLEEEQIRRDDGKYSWDCEITKGLRRKSMSLV